MPEALGIFGGTFDPVHFGHLRLAEEACRDLGLERVLWIPSGRPPHRATPQVEPRHRLDMVQQAIAGNRSFAVDGSEVAAARPSYTFDTLTRLRGEYGGEQSLVLLLGADAFAGLPTWHRWRELFALAHIAVAHRPGFPIETASLPPPLAAEFAARRGGPAALRMAPAGTIATFAMTQLAISATQIRRLLANGESVRYLLPDAVIDYIAANQLYCLP